jgi:protease I
MQKLTNKGAECTGKDVERDGNIITASGPQAAKEFGNAIAQALKE